MRRSTVAFLIAVPAVLIGLAAGAGLGVFYGPRILQHGTAATHSPGNQLYMCGMDHHIQDHPGPCDICGMQVEPLNLSSGGSHPPATGERKILYWTDPMMKPPYIADKPGKSPMGMDLVPVYEDQVSGGQEVTIDPVVVRNMGVRVARVQQGELRQTVRVVGTLAEPEQNHLAINLRVSGWIQKLYANQAGMPVNKGDPLFDLYSPELTAAADELITARKGLESSAGDAVLRKSSELVLATARRKLELLGLAPEQVEAIGKLDKAPPTVTFTSPIHGHVAEKMVLEGSAVKAGDQVMTLADRSTMWLIAQVYEEQLSLVAPGALVEVKVPALPGQTLAGKVDFIYPHLDMETRAAKVRVVLPNPEHRLHENMYATAEIAAASDGAHFLVPREAVIDTGIRQLVFVSQGDGHFAPRNVTLGRTGRAADGEAMVEVLTGLNGQETVVTSGQFLLDSESRTQEAVQKLLAGRLASQQGAATAPTQPENDAVNSLVAAYLEVEALFGPVQTDTTPADLSDVESAAQRLAADANPDLAAAGKKILTLAKALDGQPVEIQREKFKELSDAVTALAMRRKLAGQLGTLYVFDCQMTHHQWLQRTRAISNPFFPVDMKDCGDLTSTLAAEAGAAK